MNVQENKKIVDRLRRCAGQLHRVEEEIKNGADCATVIPQLLAVKGALGGTVVAYLQQALAECSEKATKDEMMTVLKSIIKNSQ